VTRPSIWSALVLPSLAVALLAIGVCFAIGRPRWSLVFVPSAVVAAIVVRHAWGWR
jgi:hypothetical protein